MAENTATFIAYLCSGKIPGISIDPPYANADVISVSIGDETPGAYPVAKVTVPILPIPPQPALDDFTVIAKIVKDGADPFACRRPDISWSVVDLYGNPDRILVTFSHPDDICSWKMTRLSSFFYGPRIEVSPGDGGEIPLTKELVFPYGKMKSEHLTRDIIPGEDLTLSWQFGSKPIKAVNSTFYHGPSITGGHVVATNVTPPSNWPPDPFNFKTDAELNAMTDAEFKAYEDALNEYKGYLFVYNEDAVFHKVNVEGKRYLLRASDFYPWEVGDWCQVVLVSENRSASDGDFDASSGFILPIEITGTF